MRVAANALTCALKDGNGNDPTPTSPVIVPIQFPGGPGLKQTGENVITSAASVTAPSGATLGTGSGQTSRIWIGVLYDGTTSTLGFYNSLNLSGPSIASWDETVLTNGTAIGGGATSAQTWYSSSAISEGTLRIIGYVESTQTTAGIWASAPSKVVLFGPGVKRPGETVQTMSTAIATASTTTSATFVALSTDQISITPRSAANLIKAGAVGNLSNTGIETMEVAMSRGTTANTNLFGGHGQFTAGANGFFGFVQPWGFDCPNTTGSQTYAVQALTAGGTLKFGDNGRAMMFAEEIQI